MRLTTIAAISSSFLLGVANAQTTLPLESNYHNDSYKNVAFLASFGGSSHYNWVLSIMDELGSRGHNTTFVATDGIVRFGQPYTYVKTVSIGPSVELTEDLVGAENINSLYTMALLSKLVNIITQYFERDYIFAKQYFVDNDIDLAVCDHFSESCVEAAKTANIPFIVTSSMDVTDGTEAPYINNKMANMYDPTTEYQPFIERFRNKFINPLRDIYYMLPFGRNFLKRKASVGIDAKFEDPSTQWKDALKLVNSLHGFSEPRPVGPLVELVGPILPKYYKALDEYLQTYLDNHQRVAYVAFGQTATPSENEIELLLAALLENVESGTLDGVIWATVDAAGLFPDTVTTSSGTTYNTQELFDGVHPHVRIVQWAPQTAVLLHPSTAVFVSHGGLGSWYESAYAGTRMIMFPFFGDQPGNSLTIERSHLGGILRYDFTPKQAAALVKKVIDDEDGKIAKNVKRFQALTQIHSKHSVIRAADIVEEVAYTHIDGKLPHRESADRRMSYIKSHNLDLYAALLLIIYSSFRAFVFLFKQLILSKPSQKVKQL